MRGIWVLLWLVPGCTWFKDNPSTLITSDPPGARVYIDGIDTGAHTPVCYDLAVNFGTNHWLVLEKPGYRPERRLLTQHTIGYTSRWIDGGADATIPPLPIFWTAGDWFFPFGVQGAIVPGEVFVKLYREDEPLLGFELLAAQRAQAEQAAAAGEARR